MIEIWVYKMEIALQLLLRLRADNKVKCKQSMKDLPPALLSDPDFCWREKSAIKSYYTLMKHKQADLWYIQIDGPEYDKKLFPIIFRDGEAFLDESNEEELEIIA